MVNNLTNFKKWSILKLSCIASWNAFISFELLSAAVAFSAHFANSEKAKQKQVTRATIDQLQPTATDGNMRENNNEPKQNGILVLWATGTPMKGCVFYLFCSIAIGPASVDNGIDLKAGRSLFWFRFAFD